MDMTLLGVVIGAILILFLIRGVGFAFARSSARNAYRNGMNAEIQQPRRRVRASGAIPSLLYGVDGGSCPTAGAGLFGWRKSVRTRTGDGGPSCVFES